MSIDKPEDSFAALFEQSSRAAPRRRRPRVGDVLDVVVAQVGKEAVFVEFEGARQAFIQSGHVRGPDGVLRVAVGDKLRARVARIDPTQGVELIPTVESAAAVGASVALGPAGAGGEAPSITLAVGQVVSGVVSRVETYGVFLQIDRTTGRVGRGLVPVVEIGAPRGTDLRKAYPLGTKLSAKVLALGEDGKIRLSLRALKDDQERAQFETFRGDGKADAPTPGFGTLGDLLKSQKPKR